MNFLARSGRQHSRQALNDVDDTVVQKRLDVGRICKVEMIELWISDAMFARQISQLC